MRKINIIITLLLLFIVLPSLGQSPPPPPDHGLAGDAVGGAAVPIGNGVFCFILTISLYVFQKIRTVHKSRKSEEFT